MLDSKHFCVRWYVVLILFIIAGPAFLELHLRDVNIRNRMAAEKKYGENSKALQKDPDLIYSGIPYAEGNNSQGQPDSEHTFEKPKNTFRIVVIGDSIAEGRYLKPEDKFSKILEKRLNADNPGRTFEVILLATIGYSTSQEIIVLKKKAFLYHPDLILWSYCLNDPQHPVFHNHLGELGQYFYEPKVYAWSYLTQKTFYINEKIKAWQLHCGNEYHTFLHCVYWDQVSANFHEIGQISQVKHVPIVLVIHPIFSKKIENFSSYPLTDLHIKLTELAKRNGMSTIDLLNPYSSYPTKALSQGRPNNRWDPWHPNTAGHRIAGEYLADILEKYFLNLSTL